MPVPSLPFRLSAGDEKNDDRESKYLNIHATKSLDSGYMWSEPWDTGVPGQPGLAVSISKDSMQGVWNELGKYSVGLPAPAILADGNVLVIYYAGEETDKTDIRWSLVRG